MPETRIYALFTANWHKEKNIRPVNDYIIHLEPLINNYYFARPKNIQSDESSVADP
jgi:hypothetical protein